VHGAVGIRGRTQAEQALGLPKCQAMTDKADPRSVDGPMPSVKKLIRLATLPETRGLIHKVRHLVTVQD
jgi:hypothetical protein